MGEDCHFQGPRGLMGGIALECVFPFHLQGCDVYPATRCTLVVHSTRRSKAGVVRCTWRWDSSEELENQCLKGVSRCIPIRLSLGNLSRVKGLCESKLGQQWKTASELARPTCA